MSKKRDPIIAVLKYFQTAELTLAQQALELAKETVRARTPGKTATSKSKPRRGLPAETTATPAN